MKILIIEDEPDLLDNMVQSLEKEKFLVETADSFLSALDKISMYDYSCILLDINLPGGSGMDILREIKKLQKTDGVIIVSAKDSLDDKITGLSFGADDYLTKPFHLAELNARINAVMRRKELGGQPILHLKNLSLDYGNRTVTIDGVALTLNRKEYDTLFYFISNKNRLITKTSLAEHVWGDQADESDNLDFIYSQIKNLRKKLKDYHAEIEIQAVYGIGYKLVVE